MLVSLSQERKEALSVRLRYAFPVLKRGERKLDMFAILSKNTFTMNLESLKGRETVGKTG